jgi:hypothetical protein
MSTAGDVAVIAIAVWLWGNSLAFALLLGRAAYKLVAEEHRADRRSDPDIDSPALSAE